MSKLQEHPEQSEKNDWLNGSLSHGLTIDCDGLV